MVIHRDLKPDNILLGGNSNMIVKICDFGASRYERKDAPMTDTVGTPLFSAPEQLACLQYDVSADVWAAGCVLTCLARDWKSPFSKAEGMSTGMRARVARGELVPRLPHDFTLLEGRKLPLQCGFVSCVVACCQHDSQRRPAAAEIAQYFAQAKAVLENEEAAACGG